MNTNRNGHIYFRTYTQVALWECEIKGQISDGMWENSNPSAHWKFWCDLEGTMAVDEPCVVPLDEKKYDVRKTRYGLSRLIPIIGDRMLKIGRLARAGGTIDACHGAEYMPETYEEWCECNKSGKWRHDFIAKYMESVIPSVAAAYYETVYTEKELRCDLKEIRLLMRTAGEFC